MTKGRWKMGVTLFELCIINIITYILSVTPSVFLLDEMLPGKMKLKTIVSISLVMSIVHGIVGSLLTDLQLSVLPAFNIILIIIFRIAIDNLILYVLFRKQSFRVYGMFVMISAIFVMIDYITAVFRWTILFELDNILAHLLLWIPFTIIGTLFTLYMMKKQSLLLKKIAFLFESPQVITLSMITFVTTELGEIIVSFLLEEYLGVARYSNRLIVISFNITIYLLVISFMMMFANNHYHKQEILTSRLTILQQETYVKRLESIQKEMRLLQHDYKNILASNYLNASDTSLEEAQRRIGESLRIANQEVANNLRHENQLSAIEILEIRSLIWSKQVETEARHIQFFLEVNQPIAQCYIRTTDLVRCLGILLDNAIEAVESLPHPSVELRIIQNNGQLIISVENEFNELVSSGEIWRTGFSTKGESRGLGLTSYQKIVDNYQNVKKETMIEGNCFIQRMTIAS